MAFRDKLDDLYGKATEMVQTGMDKATEMMQSGVTIAKLKTDNIAEEDAMRRAYLAIGKMYFELQGEHPDPAFAVECDRIRACKRRIAENNLRLAEMKNSASTEPPMPPHANAPHPPHLAPEDDPIEQPPQPPEPDVVPEEKEEIAIDELES